MADIVYASHIKSSTADGWLMPSDQLYDETLKKTQKDLNATFNTAANNTYRKTETYTRAEIDAKVSGAAGAVYRVKGTKATIAEVLALTDAIVGDTWNVTAEFTLGGKKYPAGTNVVCVTATSESAHADANWDALGGAVDLTPYDAAIRQIADGTVSATEYSLKISFIGYSPQSYTFKAATSTTMGMMSAADKAKLDGIGNATAAKAGLVKVGANIQVAADGTISVASAHGTTPGVVLPSWTFFEELDNGKLGLKAATAAQAGVVKPGSGLTVAADGTLSTAVDLTSLVNRIAALEAQLTLG